MRARGVERQRKIARGVEDAAPYGLHGNRRLPVAGRWRASAPTEWIVEFILAPEGSMWREVKKREEKRSTPAFFSFFTSRPPLWGS